MAQAQDDLFDKQVSLMTGEGGGATPDIIESELRSDYLRHAINGATLVDAAINLLEQARRNFTQSRRVADLFDEVEQINHSNTALVRLEKALKETKKITQA